MSNVNTLTNVQLGSTVVLQSSKRGIVSVDGLFGLPETRRTIFDRPESDGSQISGPSFWAARTVTIVGRIQGTSEADTWAEWEAVKGAIISSLKAKVPLYFQIPGETNRRFVWARVVGPVSAPVVVGPNMIDYDVSFLCDDPRHFENNLQSQLSTGTSQTVTNNGNTNTWLTIEIDGPCVNPVVGNSTEAKTVPFNDNGGLTIASGQTLILNMTPDTLTAKIGSTSYLDKIDWTVADFFDILSGANALTLTKSSGGTGFAWRAKWRDAWL